MSEATVAPQYAVYHHVRFLNELEYKDFVNAMAICCSKSRRTDKNRSLEALALKCSVGAARMQRAAASIESMVTRSIRESQPTDEVEKDFVNLGLQPDKVKFLAEYCHSQISSDSNESLLGSVLPASSRLVDMEWKFGVTAASSELDKLGSTFVQLKLVVSNSDGNLQNHNMVLSPSQFYNLLHELEKAKNSLDFVTV